MRRRRRVGGGGWTGWAAVPTTELRLDAPEPTTESRLAPGGGAAGLAKPAGGITLAAGGGAGGTAAPTMVAGAGGVVVGVGPVMMPVTAADVAAAASTMSRASMRRERGGRCVAATDGVGVAAGGGLTAAPSWASAGRS